MATRFTISCTILCTLILSTPATIFSQTSFTKWTTGPLVNTPSDSRSINLVDMDADGMDDIFISNGPSGGARDFLYFNRGNFVFEEDTSKFKSLIQSSVGASIGDISNSGLKSIFVASWYGQFNGHYIAETPEYWQGKNSQLRSFSEQVVLSDINNDGWLDMYVSNSGNNATDNKNFVYLNDGNGNLSIANTHILGSDFDHSRGVNFVDYNNDNLVDLFICNENLTKNVLFKNNGNGVYEKMSSAGSLLNVIGSTMSASWGDVNNDGWLDVITTNSGYFSPQKNLLFMNKGDGTFELKNGVIDSETSCSYSCSFADYDNDADLDLVITNGYCNGTLSNFLYLNDGEGNFTRDLTSIADLSTPCSYGVAWSDLDDNGFQDLVISTCKNNSGSPLANNLLYKNEGNDHHWIKINLKGTQSNADALGARIVLSTQINNKEIVQTRCISSHTSYAGQNSLTAHFGLADAQMVDSIRIFWPSGEVQKIAGVDVNQTIEITEAGSSSTGNQPDLFTCTASPNPVTDKIFIHAFFRQSPDTLFMELNDLSGKSRLKRSFDKLSMEWTYTIDTQELLLPAGVYTLSLRIPGQQIVKQIVVMK